MNYNHISKLNQFTKFSNRLNLIIRNGSFYRLSLKKRNILIHRLKRLYNQLSGIFPQFKLKHILAAAAILVLSLVGGKSAKAQYFAQPQQNPFGLTNSFYIAIPTFVDIDNDGDFDAFVGEYYGAIQYFENTGSANAPIFANAQTNPFGLDSVYQMSFPSFVDIDGDGDFDAFIGESYGAIQYFENTGTGTTPQFAAPVQNPFGLSSTYYFSCPDFVDIDNDGDFDAFIGEYYGNIQYFENIGTDTTPQFAAPVQNPFGIISNSLSVISKPSFADLDNDGDLDFLIGGYYGSLIYYENTGVDTSPVFAEPQENPFGLANTYYLSFPSCVDIDNDGDFDIFVGEYYGNIQYFENVSIPNDVGVVSINNPVSECGLGSNESVEVVIRNIGKNPQSNIPVSYRIDKGAPISDTIFSLVAAGQTYVHTFTSKVDLSVVGTTYTFDVWTSLSGDTNYFNDSSTNYIVINKPTITSYPYVENFESGTGGWSSGGENNSWQLGTPSGDIINYAASGSNSWMTNLSGYYNNFEKSYVESPCFDFTTLTEPRIEIAIWYNIEPSWDGASIQYSLDNDSIWVNIGSVSDPTNWYNYFDIDGLTWTGNGDGWSNQSLGWVIAKHDLTALAGQQKVVFRIVFGSDETEYEFDGLAFDDFRILDKIHETKDVGVINIESPKSDCSLSNSESISIKVKNFGNGNISNVPVFYSLNGGNPISETLPSIMSNRDTVYTFSEKADLSTSGIIYTFEAWTALSGDSNHFNDSIVNYKVTNKSTVTSYPYVEDFETGKGGWLSGGINNSWQFGLPAGNVIDKPASGSNAWVTNLSGFYNDYEISYVESPCFDLSTLTNPKLELNIWCNPEVEFDGAAIQYTLNKGSTWIKLYGEGDTLNWYNYNYIAGLFWTGSGRGWSLPSTEWVPAKTDLSTLEGKQEVIFRIVFGSNDIVSNFDGFAFDDFKITNKTSDIEQNKLTSEMKIYPNPSEDKIFIQFNNFSNSENISLEIVNSLGQIVLNDQINLFEKNQIKEIYVAGLPKGTYFIKLQSKDNLIIDKFVIH